MGFLLMQYEYQRASREVSVHQRAGIRLNNQVTRYTKRVERMQSLFDKAKTRLETQLNNEQNNYNALISQAATRPADFMNQMNNIVIGNTPLGAYVQFTPNGAADQQLQEVAAAAAIARTVLSTLMNALKEVEMQKLDSQQDEQLTPISEKEADLQAEKDLEDSLCEMWKQRRDNAKEQLGQDIQNGMAKYGLK